MALKRDVAQLVAHYVRDVGVAGSNPVIPTTQKASENNIACLLVLSKPNKQAATNSLLFKPNTLLE